MISITIMMVVATVQSSIVKMVPKTAYDKMIDYWLLYSFNIIIIIMIVHTIIDTYLPRDKTTNQQVSGLKNVILNLCNKLVEQIIIPASIFYTKHKFLVL